MDACGGSLIIVGVPSRNELIFYYVILFNATELTFESSSAILDSPITVEDLESFIFGFMSGTELRPYLNLS